MVRPWKATHTVPRSYGFILKELYFHSDSRMKNGLENNKIRSESIQETLEIILNIEDGRLAHAMVEEMEKKWAQIPAVLKRDDRQVW